MIVAEIKAQIAKLELQIAAIQNECNHPASARKSEHKGSSGNYDPSNDCYWINHHCLLCDKRWHQDL